MMPRNDSWHARIDDVVYYGMDWLCPPFSKVLHDRIVANIPLTPEKTIHEILPIVQTGDLHIAVYDLTDSIMYVANARGGNETGPEMAYDREFVRLDMKAIFSTSPKR